VGFDKRLGWPGWFINTSQDQEEDGRISQRYTEGLERRTRKKKIQWGVVDY
jgi:hypothetical protein